MGKEWGRNGGGMGEEWVRVTEVLMYFLRITAVQSFKLQIASLSNENCAPAHNHSQHEVRELRSCCRGRQGDCAFKITSRKLLVNVRKVK